MRSPRETRLFRTVRIVCAAVFALFSYTFMSIYQAPLLELAYDMTATGKLQYNANITAAVVTIILLIITLWLNKYAKFNREWEALAYLPASIFLAFITNIDRGIYTGVSIPASWIAIAASVILIYVTAAWVLRRVLFMRIKDITRATNRILWRNLLLLSIIFSATGFLSKCDENFKHEAMIYHYVKRGDFAKACKVGQRSLNASQELTAGRAFLLAHEGLLGEKLFTYPQYYGAEGLLPKRNCASPLSSQMVYELVDIEPQTGEAAMDYIARAAATDSAATCAKDYYLCAMLLDRRLEAFADTVAGYYDTTNAATLPMHYKEALLLSSKLNGNDAPFNDPDLEKRYNEFRLLEKEYEEPLARTNYTRKQFGTTYWWYYLYAGK
ncbi:MAG: hypothetical protein IKW61_07800 [Bacteroidaceae bacterium]|nr:hypothetical protein [Bacteroidaceae bacterium]